MIPFEELCAALERHRLAGAAPEVPVEVAGESTQVGYASVGDGEDSAQEISEEAIASERVDRSEEIDLNDVIDEGLNN